MKWTVENLAHVKSYTGGEIQKLQMGCQFFGSVEVELFDNLV